MMYVPPPPFLLHILTRGTQDDTLETDQIGIRDAAKMPPLLQRLSERQPENLDYLGVSYGITPLLFKFWKRAGYVPLYVRQTQNDLTGEHTCVMVRGLNKNENVASAWLSSFALGSSSFVNGDWNETDTDEMLWQTSGNDSSRCFRTSSGTSLR